MASRLHQWSLEDGTIGVSMNLEVPSPSTTLRIAKANASQLSVCIQNGLWAATKNRLAGWNLGDRLLVFAEDGQILLGTVTGPWYESDLLIFEGGFFPYRIPLNIGTIVDSPRSASTMREVRRLLSSHYGSRYGIRILMQLPLVPELSTKIIEVIEGDAAVCTTK